MTVRYNTLEKIGYNGIDVFGYDNTFDSNVIRSACISKGDCGAIRTFGGDSLADTTVRNITIVRHIITNTLGNTDGARSDFDALFGFGLYIDHNSNNVTASDNTIISSTVHGILYQDSTGTITGNTLYNNSASPALWASQVDVTGGSFVGTLQNNILLGLQAKAATLSADNAAQLGTSDYNHFYHANRAAHISVQGDKTLAAWRTYSGKDAHSTEMISATLAQSEIFYNDTRLSKTFTLTRPYVDLNGSSVVGSLTLQPFTSRILLPDLTPIPHLSIVGAAPITARSGDSITYTFTVSNLGIASATHLLITSTLPSGAYYLSGGTLTGNVVSWTLSSLAPSANASVTCAVTATVTLINADYGVSADGGYHATGQPVVTIVDPQSVYLPLVSR